MQLLRKFFATMVVGVLLCTVNLQEVYAADALTPFNFYVNNVYGSLLTTPGSTLTLKALATVANNVANHVRADFTFSDTHFTYNNATSTINSTDTTGFTAIMPVPASGTEVNNNVFNPPVDNTVQLAATTVIGKAYQIKNVTLTLAKPIAATQNVMTAQMFSDDVSSVLQTTTVYIDSRPHITSAVLSPTAISNNGSASTNLTVTVVDNNGCSDMDNSGTAHVTADLSALGGSATTALSYVSCDGATNTATWQKTNITTGVAAGSATIPLSAVNGVGNANLPTDTNFGSIDLNPSSVVLTINDAAAPSVTGVTLGDTYIGSTLKSSTSLSWTGSEVGMYKVVVGASANCSSGTVVSDWTATGNGSGSVTVLASSLASGSNTLYVCLKNAAGTLIGSNSTTITKDVTPPTATFVGLNPASVTTGDSSVSFSCNEIGTYQIQIGGTGVEDGVSRASGAYGTAGATQSVTISNAWLVGGSNTIYVYCEDRALNYAGFHQTVTEVTPPPSMAGEMVTFSDHDVTYAGVDGRDFTVTWTAAAAVTSYAYFNAFNIYILPVATTLDTSVHTSVQSIPTQSATSVTLDVSVIHDSAGAVLTGGTDYKVYVAEASAVQVGVAGASATGQVIADDPYPPVLVSARATSVTNVEMTFNKAISTVDISKITGTGITGNIGSAAVSGTPTVVNMTLTTPVATNFTASDLNFGACAVRDSAGTSGANCGSGTTNGTVNTATNYAVGSDIFFQAPSTIGATTTSLVGFFPGEKVVVSSGGGANAGRVFTVASASIGTNITVVETNVTAAAAGATTLSPVRAVADAIPPKMTPITVAQQRVTPASPPSAGNFIASRVAVSYTLSEAATSGTVSLTFTRTGGAVDAASPHVIALTDALVGGSATSAGVKNFTLNYADLKGDASNNALVNGATYAVTMGATDVPGNVGASTGPSMTLNVTVPAAAVPAPVATPIASTPTFTWSTVSGAASYRWQLSMVSDFSVLASDISGIVPTSYTPGTSLTTNGTYYWRVFAMDSTGNYSDPAATGSNSFVFDTTPPSGGSFTINSGAGYTNDAGGNVTLNVTCPTDSWATVQMAYGTAAAPTNWVTCASTQALTLTAGDGTKTVYMRWRDGGLNMTSDSTQTIVRDNTAPATPSITAADAAGGADVGKTNVATITIGITGDTDATAGVTKWCVLSNPSGNAAPGDPTSGTCSAPTGGNASGWVTSRPTTHTFGSIGSKHVYVWTQDAATNVSASSSAATIDYETALPATPTISVDSGAAYTNTQTAALTIGNDGTAWKYIVNETQSTAPAKTSGSWVTKPTSLLLSAAQGLKTVYLWVKDAYGNVSAVVASAAITYDTVPPTISTVRTLDLNGDGYLDAVQVTMSESILDSTITLSNFTLGSGYTLLNGSGVLGGVTFANGIATGSSANDAIFYLAITPKVVMDTGAVPTLTYTKGTLTDLAGNSLATTSALTPTDGAAPHVVAVNPIRVLDSTSNGKADQIKIVYSEALATTTASVPWTVLGIPSNGTVASVALGTTTIVNDTVVITLNEGASAADTTAGTCTVALDNTTAAIKDAASNTAVAFSASACADYMPPVLVSANYISTGTLTSDTLITTYSEPLADSTTFTTTTATHYFTLASGGVITNSTADTGSTANDSSATLYLHSGDTAPTVGTSTLALKSGVVMDAAGNANTGTAAVTVRGGFVINEVQWGGMAGVTTDQYVELRNMSATATQDFTVTPSVLCQSTTVVKALTTGTIAPSSYYLITNLSSGSKVSVTPDVTGFGTALTAGSTLTLRTGSSCTAGVVLDSATIFSGGSAIGGNNVSMERNDAPGDGTSTASWHAAVKGDTGFTAQYVYFGTPKAANLLDSVAPTFDVVSPDNRFPAAQALLAVAPSRLSVTYSDNVGGSGVKPGSVQVDVDANGDGAFTGTDLGSNASGICRAAQLTTLTATQVVCVPAVLLGAGKHTVRVTIADYGGNTTTASWDFWVDNFSVQVSNVTAANLGTAAAGFPASLTDDVTKLTKIVVTTYGAGVSITGTPSGVMSSGANQIGWPGSTNKAALTTGVDLGAWYRVKLGAGGAYGNYFNFNATPQIVNVTKSSGASLASTNALQTYTFYVQYYVDVASLQKAGYYANTVGYSITPGY